MENVKDINLHREYIDLGRPTSSVSLPPSPNRGNFLTGESPPTLHPNDLHRAGNRAGLVNRTRKVPNTINEESVEENVGLRKPLVQTQYVAWACKYFAQPVKKEPEEDDFESPTHYEREWRYMRNAALRYEAREEQLRINSSRLEVQVFNTRNPHPPTVIQFHPYDQQLAVAGKDSFGIWDWGTGAKLTYCSSKGSKHPMSKLTALEWINGHDVALLMAASDDGTIKVWRPSYSPYSREPVLVSAWQALTDLQPAKSNSNAGVVMCWEQSTQTIITSGDVRLIRIWDTERELKDYDIPTGSDSSVTCIDSSYTNMTRSYHSTGFESPVSTPEDEGLVMKNELGGGDYVHRNKDGLIAIGCSDGSVRLFDRRCSPNEARIKTWREHTSWVLGLQLRGDKIISGCLGGDIRIFDIRQNSSVSVCQVANDMTALSVHRKADTYACGSVNPTISIHNLAGQTLNTIRFYEGFMGHRTGPVCCLSYHPHRVALAAGTIDSSISVYCIDHKR